MGSRVSTLKIWLLPAIGGLGVIGAFGARARADVVSVGALQDAMIFGTAAGADTGNASGKGPALFAGADGSGNIKRSLIEFNVAGANIPSGATITGATVTLYLAQVAGSGGGTGSGSIPSRIFGLYDLEQSWGEGNSGSPTSASVGGTGQGYPEQNGDSTWTDAFYNTTSSLAVPWSSNGTPVLGGNYSSTESGQTTITTVGALNSGVTFSSAGLATDVQSWVDGAATNDGWLLKSDNLEGTKTSFLGFWSKDGAAANNNPAIAPALTITYTVVPVPESCAGTIIGLAGAAALSRRQSRTRQGTV